MELELRNRAAIITGAASGIGRALAYDCASRGMQVCIADFNAAGLEETENELKKRQAKVLSRVVDVRSAEGIEEFVAASFKEFPSVALAFANAGVIRYSSTIRPVMEDWKFQIDINLWGVIHMLNAVVPRMADKNEPAQFVMTGSQASFVTAPEIAAYCAAKHGVWGIATVLDAELKAANSPVGVTMLAPPRVATGIVSTSKERVRAAQGDKAADEFFASLMTPEFVAKLTIDKAVERNLYALPDNTYKDMFVERVQPLLDY